jgi:hypothetical protein
MSHAPVIRTLLSAPRNFAGPDPAARTAVESLPEEARRALAILSRAKQKRTNLNAEIEAALPDVEEATEEIRVRWAALLRRAVDFRTQLEAGIAELEEILNSIE